MRLKFINFYFENTQRKQKEREKWFKVSKNGKINKLGEY